MESQPRVVQGVSFLGPNEQPVPDQPRAVQIAAAAGLIAVSVWAMSLTTHGPRLRHLATAAAAGIASAAMLRRGWGRERLARQPWSVMAVAAAVWAMGQLAAASAGTRPADGLISAVRGQAGYLAMWPLLAAGVLLLAPIRPWIGQRHLLELLIAAGTVASLIWTVTLAPLWAGATPDVVRAVLVLHAVGNGCLLLAVIATGLRLGDRMTAPPALALGGGMVALVVGDTLALHQWAVNQPPGPNGTILNLLGWLSFGWGALAGQRARPGATGFTPLAADADEQRDRWRAAVPLVTAIGLLGLTGMQILGGAPGVVLLGQLAVIGLLVARQELVTRDARRLTRRLSLQVDRDPLTGLINHRRVHERLERELAHGLACGHPVAIALIDVDNFKRVNDTCGHQAGDQVLWALAGILSAACRGTDVAARYAGDEFLLVLPGVDLRDGRALCDRIVRDVRLHGPRFKLPPSVSISLSVGLAVSHRHQRPARQVVAIADAAMYDAKEAGKDRVVVVDADTLIAGPDPAPPHMLAPNFIAFEDIVTSVVPA